MREKSYTHRGEPWTRFMASFTIDPELIHKNDTGSSFNTIADRINHERNIRV